VPFTRCARRERAHRQGRARAGGAAARCRTPAGGSVRRDGGMAAAAIRRRAGCCGGGGCGGARRGVHLGRQAAAGRSWAGAWCLSAPPSASHSRGLNACPLTLFVAELLLLLFAAALSNHRGCPEHKAKGCGKPSTELNGPRTPEIRCSRNALSSPEVTESLSG
jgi:hypothetical protein